MLAMITHFKTFAVCAILAVILGSTIPKPADAATDTLIVAGGVFGVLRLILKKWMA